MQAVVLALSAGWITAGTLPAAPAMSQDPAEIRADFRDAPADAPIADHRVWLLDVAIESVSRMPLDPHIKNRSRAQHAVATAALELDQPRLALGYMSRIDNWRRGAVAAEYMLYAARRDHTEKMDRYERIARGSAELATQDWRREYIHLTLAQARLVMGNRAPADEFNTHLQNESYFGRITQIEAEQHEPGDDASYQRLIEALDRLVERNHYEVILNSAQAYVTLYDKHYDNAPRRDAIQTKLRSAYQHMPGPETIDLLIDLSDVAVRHDDQQRARSLMDEAQQIYAKAAWSAHREYEYQYAGKLAEARYRAGDAQGARALVDAALAQFDQRESGIYNLWRPDCLRPLAEACQLIGEAAKARSLYARALEAGALNPNGRPQAEDLAKTCTSMALSGFKPDTALWEDIHRLRDQLSDPW